MGVISVIYASVHLELLHIFLLDAKNDFMPEKLIVAKKWKRLFEAN